MNFDELLTRADEGTLQNLLGAPAVRLLRLLDPQLSSTQSLRQLVVDLHTREGLLLADASRRQLIDLMRPNSARILATILGVPDAADAYEGLASVGVSRGSARERKLLEFFELVVPPIQLDRAPELEHVEGGYTLFAHQRRAARGIKLLLAQAPRRALLHMPTGAGKTRTAMHLVADTLRSREPALVVWLAHSEELCEQAADEFLRAWSHLGDRDVALHRLWGKRSLDPAAARDGLLVAGLAKIYAASKADIGFISRLSNHCALVVIDEAHQAVAETYRLVLDTLALERPDTPLLGLTATPGRTWSDVDADQELANFFARRKVTLTVAGYTSPVDFLVAEGYLARVHFRSLFYNSGIQLSDSDLLYIKEQLELPRHILESLGADEQRNLRIVLEAEGLAKRHRRILVFAASVANSNLIATVLRARGYDASSITANTPPGIRSEIIQGFRGDKPEVKILCNFGVLTTGFDAPQTSAAIIARPTLSLVLYSQMIGRATRGPKAGGNASAEIVTVVDQELPGFKSMTEAFNNWDDVWD